MIHQTCIRHPDRLTVAYDGIFCEECARAEYELQKQARIDKYMRHSHLPQRHVENLPNIENKDKRFSEYDGKSYALVGAPGTGKTQSAVLAGMVYIRKDHTCIYALCLDFVNDYYATGFESKARMMRAWSEVDLLILDQIEWCVKSDSSLELVKVLVDKRYQAKRPTILISNKTPEELDRVHGAALLDRIKEDGELIVFKGRNWRVK
jgi:DNA replication protein DnaC